MAHLQILHHPAALTGDRDHAGAAVLPTELRDSHPGQGGGGTCVTSTTIIEKIQAVDIGHLTWNNNVTVQGIIQ